MTEDKSQKEKVPELKSNVIRFDKIFREDQMKGHTSTILAERRIEQEAEKVVAKSVGGTMSSVDKELEIPEDLSEDEAQAFREAEAIAVTSFKSLPKDDQKILYRSYRSVKSEISKEEEKKQKETKEKEANKRKKSEPQVESDPLKMKQLNENGLNALTALGLMTLEGLRKRFPKKENFEAMLRKILKAASQAKISHEYPLTRMFGFYFDRVFMKDAKGLEKFLTSFDLSEEEIKKLASLRKLKTESDIPENEKEAVINVLHEKVLVNTSRGNISDMLTLLADSLLQRGKEKLNSPGVDGVRLMTEIAFLIDSEDYRHLMQFLIHRRYYPDVEKGAQAA